MTISEIKEYIDLQIDNSKHEEQTDFQMTHRLYRANMRHIRLMLDELEPTLLPNKQILWERDMAIKQLHDLGYKFCAEPKENKV